MHEVFLPIMIMIFTLLVMLGLVLVFRVWMVERDRIIDAGGADGRREGAAAE